MELKLKLEFHIVFMCHKIYSSEMYFQPFRNVKLSLNLMGHRKIDSGLNLTCGHNLPITELGKQCNQNWGRLWLISQCP